MSLLKNLQKTVKAHHVISLVAAVVLIYAIVQYSRGKGLVSDNFGLPQPQVKSNPPSSMAAQPAEPLGQNEVFADVSGIKTTSFGLPPSCSKGNVVDPAELLPKDMNNQWAQLNPSGSSDFNNVNLLKAGYHIGIDTVGSSLRNANLQVRSEPPNPTVAVSPWMNTTIEPDLMRTPLEIGCGAQ